MLRKILLSTVFVAAATSSFAADLPYRTAAPAPYAAAMPVFTWTGFYVGVNAGGDWNKKSGYTTNVPANYPIYGGANGNSDLGFTGGAQVGYNMQFGNFVAGVEADINYLGGNRGSNGVFPSVAEPASNTDFRITQSESSKWFGTARGRLGFAFDRALIYATGGLAFGGKGGGSNVDQRDYGYIVPAVGLAGPTWGQTTVPLNGTGNSSSNIGWALGGGMEYALSNAWSVKAEYLHVDLGRNTRTFTTLAAPANGSGYAGGNAITVRKDNKFDIVRAGVNYRF